MGNIFLWLSRNCCILALLCMAFILPGPTSVMAAPVVSGVSGTISDGQTITISGSSFGADGPNIVVFDDFELFNNGDVIGSIGRNAPVGSWRQVRTNGSTYSTNYHRSGTKCIRTYWGNQEGNAWFAPVISSSSNKWFISFWQFIPSGSNVPGSNIGSPNWKFYWLSSNDVFQNDYVGATGSDPPANLYPSAPLDGSRNRIGLGYMNVPFGKNNWARFDNFVVGSTSNGTVQSWYMDASHARYQLGLVSGGRTLDDGTTGWGYLHFSAYGRQDPNANTYLDDIYVANGPGALARVEIGNNANYASCTNLAICTVKSWSGSSVQATARLGSFTAGSHAYLFVIDSTGTVSQSYPVTIGTSGTPPPTTCNFSLNSTSASLDSTAHTGTINMSASGTSCAWTAVSNSSWISITSGASGTGSGSVQYSVAQNTSTSPRTGTIAVAGATYTVSQAAATAACSFTMNPTSVSLSNMMQTGSITVSSSTSSCTWSAVSNQAWITISSGSSGTRTGSGTVQYSVTQNTSTSPRTGNINIAGKVFTVQQAAASGISCSFTLDKNMTTFDYTAQTGNIAVTPSASTCTWTAVSDASWITITSGSSGTGPGTVQFSVSTNTSTSRRSGTITIGSLAYTVYQAAYGHKKPHPPRNLRTLKL